MSESGISGLCVAQAQAELVADLRHHVEWTLRQGVTADQVAAWYAVLEVAVDGELKGLGIEASRSQFARGSVDDEAVALAQYEALADLRHHLTWLRGQGARHEAHFRRSLVALLALTDAESVYDSAAMPSDFASFN